ncbi:MAG: ribonuclease H-like domain-containing protein [Bacillota bacterium]|nr:ribonuclease H-like domain-containing protein [Bacillota bacterium]
MKHIVETWDEKLYESVTWDFYFEGLNIGVLDIETTGLDPARNKFVLGCLLDVSKAELHQVIARSRAEEAVALGTYMRLLEDLDAVITYNGRRFDIPFLQRRRQACMGALDYLKQEENGGCRTHDEGTSFYDLDLFQVLDKHSALRKILPNLKQKTVENYMGLWETRADRISGGESVELYDEYEATGDEAIEKKLLLHNRDDVKQLARLTRAVSKCDFHAAMFRQGFPIKTGSLLLRVENMRLEKEGLSCRGTQLRTPIDYMGFELDGWSVTSRFYKDRMAKSRGAFEIKLPLIRREGYVIVDLQAAGLLAEEFAGYPDSGSGFLVIGDPDGVRYRQTNHFIKSFIKRMAASSRL